MWIHILVFLSFCVLFFNLKGFFSKAGVFLAAKLPEYLQLKSKYIGIGLLLIFAGNLLGMAVSFSGYMQSATVRNGYLIRNGKGEGSYEEELLVSDGKYTERVNILVSEIAYTDEELKAFLDDALASMDERILGENKIFARIEYPMILPAELEDTPVTIEWNTDYPLYLDWEGAIGEEVPEEGVKVHLTGELRAGEYMRLYERDLTVYPERLSERKNLVRSIEKQMEEDASNEKEQRLPTEANGKSLIWHKEYAGDGWMILFLSLAAGVLVPFLEKSKKAEEAKKRERMLKTAYPMVLNKLILYMRAGSSCRTALQRMMELYENHPAYEELKRTYWEMQQGIPEEQAYERLGIRCGCMEYKTLASLLVQNLKKGSSHVITALEEECQRAFEERKRTARIAGEEAGTKLLFPMILMLMIVLMMIVVPSFLAM